MSFHKVEKRNYGTIRDAIRVTHRIRKSNKHQSSIEIYIGPGVLRHLEWTDDDIRVSASIGAGEDDGVLAICRTEDADGFKLSRIKQRRVVRTARKFAFTPDPKRVASIGVKRGVTRLFEHGDFEVHDGAIYLDTKAT